MNRRDFLKYSGIAGAGAAFPSLNLSAAHDGYTGPLWLTIDALGGWDPTSFCDPKGYINKLDKLKVNDYPAKAIQTIPGSTITIAPPPDTFKPATQPYLMLNFFNKYKNKLLVVNGIDNQTNSHSDGQRHTWSGELGRQGHPNIGALIAASLASKRAMPFIANAGYISGAGLTTPVTITNAGLSALLEIAYPNRSGPAQNSTSPDYYSKNVLNLIKTAVSGKRQTLLAQQRLPRIRDAIQKLISSSSSLGHMTDLADFLEANPPNARSTFGSDYSYYLYLQGRIALAAYKTGVTASAHIYTVGFDTHSDHDLRHYPSLLNLFEAWDTILVESEVKYGLADKVVTMAGSDFARTNRYNKGNGKDHWPITSMLFMGTTQYPIRGNRVVGKTTKDHKAIKIDPTSLVPDINNTNPNSVYITPAHIHRSIRKLAGIETNAFSRQFDLKGSDINLFA